MELSLAERLPVPSVSETLGYLAPGAAFMSVVYVSEAYAAHVGTHGFHTPVHTVLSFIGLSASADSWVDQLLIIVAIGFLCYMLGHLIDSVAKLLLDRTLVYKGYGYPYQSLLDLPGAERRQESREVLDGLERSLRRDRPWLTAEALSEEASRLVATVPRRSDFSAAFYRGFFFWFNLYLIARWGGLASAAHHGYGDQNFLWHFANVLGVWCSMLLAIKLFAGRSVRALIRRVHAGAVDGRRRRASRGLLCVYRAASIGLYDIIAVPIGKMLNTRRSLDAAFISAYRVRFRNRFNLDPDTAESNNFWLPLMDVLMHAPELGSLLSRYHQLYRFSRNLSVALFMGFSYVVVWYYGNTRGPASPAHAEFVLLMFLVYVAALLFLLHYYYLYVCYYSKFLFRAFVFMGQEHGAVREPVAPYAGQRAGAGAPLM